MPANLFPQALTAYVALCTRLCISMFAHATTSPPCLFYLVHARLAFSSQLGIHSIAVMSFTDSPLSPVLGAPCSAAEHSGYFLALHLCHCLITIRLCLHLLHLRSWLVFDPAHNRYSICFFSPLLLACCLAFFSIGFSKLGKLLNECMHEYLECILKILLVV